MSLRNVKQKYRCLTSRSAVDTARNSTDFAIKADSEFLQTQHNTLYISQPMNDHTLRAHLRKNLLLCHQSEPDTVLLDELRLRQGETRVDVALVNGLLHGYEIKSARDTLKRLPQQILSYSLVVDKATLVVADRHLTAAIQILPEWWGVEVVAEDEAGNPHFEELRPSQTNPHIDAFHVAELLWREEALQLLEERGLARGYRSKSRAVLHERIAEVVEIEEIQACVRHYLKNRTGWKSASLLTTNGG